ncbi:MAG: hypothetical protein U0795_22065 [Pirellulales bacterium]
MKLTRCLALGLVCGLATVMLTGCGSSSAPVQPPTVADDPHGTPATHQESDTPVAAAGSQTNGDDATAPAVGGESGGTAVAEVDSLPSHASGAISPTRTALPQVVLAGKVELRRGEGEEVGSFKPKGTDACKFYDASGRELCKLTLSPGHLKVKSADDVPLFELKAKDDKLMLKDASGERELFKIKFKGDTLDFYLPHDVRTYRIKRQDYGWRLEDNGDKTLFRAKKTDDRVVLRDSSDQTVLYSHDFTSPLGLVFFKIDALSIEQQAALCLYFLDK